MLLFVVQDVAHAGYGTCVPRPRQRLSRSQLIAGFEVSINCRFWLSTEAHGLPLVGHAPGFTAADILDAGQDGIEHVFTRPFPPGATREERLAIWSRYARAGVSVTPTATAYHSRLVPLEQLRIILEDESGVVEPRRRYLSRYLIRDWREQLAEITTEYQQQVRQMWDQRVRDFREMHEAGVDLLVGSDVGLLHVYPGWSLHDELALFVTDFGMTPAEALERATHRSARFLRLSDSIGTIERGKIADLVLLDADPLADIANTRRISGVVLRGRFYNRGALEQIRTRVLKAPDIHTDDWGRR